MILAVESGRLKAQIRRGLVDAAGGPCARLSPDGHDCQRETGHTGPHSHEERRSTWRWTT